MRLARWCAAGVMALALGAGAASARPHPWQHYRLDDVSSEVRRLNALRASFGAPAVTENRAWTIGCARHAAYMERHGLQHDEVPGASGYTVDGAEAGMHAVLAWPAAQPFPGRVPLGAWGMAPYHQAQLLDPRLARVGMSRGCVNTLSGIAYEDGPLALVDDGELPGAVPPPRLLLWPGQAASGVPRAIDACDELPTNPFGDVGWSCGRVGTAFYLYALDAGRMACAPDAGPPVVEVTSHAQTIPIAVVPSTACGWIVLTGRPLPRNATVDVVVHLAGATLEHVFSTRSSRPARRAR